MRRQLFLGALTFASSLFLFPSPSVHNEYSLAPGMNQNPLPGSAKVHEKIGRHNFYEKHHATITFTKKTADDVDLKRLILKWSGDPIITPGLSATLFLKTGNELLPIKENYVAGGTWDSVHQQLRFQFPKAYSLRGKTTFAVVLSLNKELDEQLQKGTFELVTDSLPEGFQPQAEKQTHAKVAS